MLFFELNKNRRHNANDHTRLEFENYDNNMASWDARFRLSFDIACLHARLNFPAGMANAQSQLSLFEPDFHRQRSAPDLLRMRDPDGEYCRIDWRAWRLVQRLFRTVSSASFKLMAYIYIQQENSFGRDMGTHDADRFGNHRIFARWPIHDCLLDPITRQRDAYHPESRYNQSVGSCWCRRQCRTAGIRLPFD